LTPARDPAQPAPWLVHFAGVAMKRRTFCAAGLAGVVAAALPRAPAWAAAGPADIAAVTLDGKPLLLRGADLEALRASVRGELITAEDPAYESARHLWNPSFERRPALIVRCAGAADVRSAVNFAAAHGVLTAVRGGGHSLSGQSGCDGGLVIDLSPMRAVEVDPVAKLARVEGGALLGQVDRESLAFGLATPVGTVGDTGVAGLTLGGGVGRIGRKFGLTCDNLIAAELITADGSWVKVTESENPDLLWALRGGGGNYGVVTAFIFGLHPVNPVMFGGDLTFPFAGARERLRGYAEIEAAAPDELYVDVAMARGANAKDPGWLSFNVCYCGPPGDAERAVRALRKLGKPLSDELAPAPYAKLQGSADLRGISPLGTYGRGGTIYGITPTLIDTVVGALEAAPSEHDIIWLQHQGGAISRVAPQATAFFNRGATHNLGIFTAWKMPQTADEHEVEWVRRSWAKIEPQTRGQYVNLAATEDREARVHAAYGDNYARLAALKKQYDPANLFRLNANVKPA
jgi:FAD/FMN-containing dehydrogenase